jgi:hypothetical protein
MKVLFFGRQTLFLLVPWQAAEAAVGLLHSSSTTLLYQGLLRMALPPPVDDRHFSCGLQPHMHRAGVPDLDALSMSDN